MPCCLRYTADMTAAVRMTDCEWTSDGIHIQRIDNKSYLSAHHNKKHVYWSDTLSDAQVFTLDSENWVVTINGTYMEMNEKKDTLWQIYPEYKDDEDSYCMRLEKQETLEEDDEPEEEEIKDDMHEKEEPEEEEIKDDMHEKEDEIEDDLENLAKQLEKDMDVESIATSEFSSTDDGENEKKVKKPKPPSLVAEKNFIDYKRQKMLDENPDMRKGDITKKLKKMWKELSKEQKNKYYDNTEDSAR